MLNALYNQVDEEVHKLVILSNKSQKDLDSLLEVRRFEEQSEQVGFPSLAPCPHPFSTLHTLLTTRCDLPNPPPPPLTHPSTLDQGMVQL